MGIEIINAGFYTTIQDQGRFGYQQYGMPVSGAMDLRSMYLGNILVGNSFATECLEATVIGPKLQFTKPNLFAVTGGECKVSLSGKELELHKAYVADSGDILDISAVTKGCRVYITFAGGLEVPTVMGSKSTYIKGKIGGLDGRNLLLGDHIAFSAPRTKIKNLEFRKIPNSYIYDKDIFQQVRIVLGPQETYFSPEGIQTFFSEEYQVTNESDRMGYRLTGKAIEHAAGQDGNIISDAIVFGAIQVPEHGLPIIMMADRQTTGGYTKIGTVISVDLPKIAQAKAGDKLHFLECDILTAQALYQEYWKSLEALKRLFDEETIISTDSLKMNLQHKSFLVEITEINHK